MADTGRLDSLAAECATLTRYLTGQAVSPEVATAYRRAHDIGGVCDALAGGVAPSLDAALLTMARMSPRAARLADAYATLFARPSLLRRKLVLLLAILESRGDSARAIDAADPGSPAVWIVTAGAEVVAFALRLSASIVLVTPLRVWYRLAGVRGA